jgi:hypothetical protein
MFWDSTEEGLSFSVIAGCPYSKIKMRSGANGCSQSKGKLSKPAIVHHGSRSANLEVLYGGMGWHRLLNLS